MPYPGMPKETPIPSHLDRWNWGAFLLNIIWGIGNNTYRAFLVIIPFYGFYVLYQLGRYGSQWAWQNRLWGNEEHFVKTQRNWARAGVLVLAIMLLLNIALMTLLFSLFANSDVVKKSMKLVRSEATMIEAMGEPIERGWFISGSMRTSPTDGEAHLNIPISGPKCSGSARSIALKNQHEWMIESLIVTLDCKNQSLELIK